MKNKEQIEEEYRKYISPTSYIVNETDLDIYFSVKKAYYKEALKMLVDCSKNNKINRATEKLINIFTAKDDSNLQIYDAKADIYSEEIDLCITYSTYLKNIIKSKDIDKREKLKLSDFMNDYFISNLLYLNDLQKRAVNYYNGIDYIGCEEDTREAFDAFMYTKLNKYSKNKEKTKKMN